MNQIVLHTAATGATTAAGCYFDSSQYEGFTVSCDVLAGLETCPISIELAGTMRAQYDDSGAALELTPTRPSLWLVGGPKYGFAKAITASPCGVYVIPGPRVQR